MAIKKSLLDRIPLTKSIKADVTLIMKTLAEELSVDSVNNLFKNPSDLGQKQSGERITPDEVAADGDYTILGTVNGIVIRKNLKTGDISIVAEDPSKVAINSEEDAKRIEALANVAKGVSDEESKPSDNTTNQRQANSINTNQQKQEQKSGVFETIFLDFDTANKLKPFLDKASSEYADKSDDEESDESSEDNKDSEEETEEEKHEDSEHNKNADNVSTSDVEVAPAGDSLTTMDPMDTVNAFPDHWQSSYNYSPDEMLAQVRAAQINTGGPMVQAMIDPSVMELPVTRPANMSPGVSNLNIKEPIPDDYAFSMGNNPLSIKLSLEIGGN